MNRYTIEKALEVVACMYCFKTENCPHCYGVGKILRLAVLEEPASAAGMLDMIKAFAARPLSLYGDIEYAKQALEEDSTLPCAFALTEDAIVCVRRSLRW